MKIEFITGSMFSGKSREIIDFLTQCEKEEKKVLKLKPVADTRDLLTIKSRDREKTFSCMGIAQVTNPITGELYDLFPSLEKSELENYDAIVIDEAQFLTPEGMKFLIDLSKDSELPLIISGLTRDFRGEVFPSIRLLLETYGEEVMVYELRANCFSCGEENAVHSCRVKNNEIVLDGAVKEIGDSESYIALCTDCLSKKVKLERKGE